ncbi:transcription initiation factor TFIIB [Kwoniella heveanensis CBS 569]|uniref:Transcription initiation factor IIB n=1 Tax=Kwoniella heveanensis BCC8398 TaxID=1296120 RepID=A0A1B9GN28_9TREE|nr:transcription initiation factor TFIIB [Kwoniella heveanensis BCC8398]OCF40410.1 transcription initiation factor TFIIB [Kwoniella heveanensis CBS 569]
MAVAGPKQPGPKFGQSVAPNLNVRHLCPNCRSDPPNIIEEYSKGDLVCGDCGTILGDRIVDTRSEWRTFAGDENGDDPSRVGDAGNPLLGSNHLDTVISHKDGRSGIARDLNRAVNRANNLSNGINGKTNTAILSAVFSRIGEKCDAMQLPRGVRERAQHVYKIADDQKAIKGKNEAAIIAACIIYACRDAGAHRTFQEVCKALKITKKELGQVFSVIKNAVQASGTKTGAMESVHGSNNAQESAEALLGRFTNYLDLGNAVFNASKHVAGEAVARTVIDGRSPVSIAAGVLYFTCVLLGRSTSAKDIAAMGGVSESTTKLICKMVATKLDEIIRPEWKTEYKKGYAALAQLGRINDSAKNSRSGTPSRLTPSSATTSAPVSAPPNNGNGNANGNGIANGNGHLDKQVKANGHAQADGIKLNGNANGEGSITQQKAEASTSANGKKEDGDVEMKREENGKTEK